LPEGAQHAGTERIDLALASDEQHMVLAARNIDHALALLVV
jgi:hypothetical protein